MPRRVHSVGCVVALAAAISAAFPLSASAYTLRLTRAGLPVRWVAATVPMRVDPQLVSDSDESMAAAQLGFDAWRGMRGVPTLELRGETQRAPGFDPRGDNENGVYRVASLPISGIALAVTVSTYRQDDGELLDADILILRSREVALLGDAPRGRDLRSYDLASLIAHESGHVLGLGESGDDDAATMWPRLRLGDVSARTLEADDVDGVREIYADAGVRTQASCGASGAPGRTRSGVAALSSLCALAWFAASRRRARRRLLALGAAAAALVCAFFARSPAARADDASLGCAHVIDVRWEDGILITEFDVTTPTGHERALIAGGTRDGIVQLVGDALPPADGDEVRLEVVVATGERQWTSRAAQRVDEPHERAAATTVR